jgi:GxxExxY protein
MKIKPLTVSPQFPFFQKIEEAYPNKNKVHVFCDNAPYYRNNTMDSNDKNDLTIRTIKEEKELLHSELTHTILGCCFEVISELGPGFLEKVCKNALLIAMRQKGLQVGIESSYEVIFRGKVIGKYIADLVVNNAVIVELKCCENLISEHQAQLFNYLKVSGLSVGLLINFRRRKLEWKRLESKEKNSDSQEVGELMKQ